jgi:hypothetical protein
MAAYYLYRCRRHIYVSHLICQLQKIQLINYNYFKLHSYHDLYTQLMIVFNYIFLTFYMHIFTKHTSCRHVTKIHYNADASSQINLCLPDLISVIIEIDPGIHVQLIKLRILWIYFCSAHMQVRFIGENFV